MIFEIVHEGRNLGLEGGQGLPGGGGGGARGVGGRSLGGLDEGAPALHGGLVALVLAVLRGTEASGRSGRGSAGAFEPPVARPTACPALHSAPGAW